MHCKLRVEILPYVDFQSKMNEHTFFMDGMKILINLFIYFWIIVILILEYITSSHNSF